MSREKSKVREWLNSVFRRRAFKEEEKALLQVTQITTTASGLSDRTTYDKIYLPSIEEVRYGFDGPTSMGRGGGRTKRELDIAPCSQYVAALGGGQFKHSSYGPRSRGHIDTDGSYKCAENFEGHAIIDNKFSEWRLNCGMGLRPVICVEEADIVEMV